ncbi:synemin [Rhinoraja longicauda]
MFPFKSTILHERSQLQELNCRLGSYLSRVRELERENQLLGVEIGRLRQAGATEWGGPSAEEIAKARLELEELTLERAMTEIQRRNLQQGVQELRDRCAVEQTLHKNMRQEMEAHRETLQQTDATNTSLEGVISQLQAEYRALEAQHGREQREVEEELRRGSQLLVRQRYPTGPAHIDSHSLAYSEIWQENLEVCRLKIEELEAAGQQDKARREEINRENGRLLGEMETLKSELEDQFILQSQLEEDFLTFHQGHGEDVEEYQSQVDVLEDEKQHLASAIALNLKEQQKLMQVKMGLNLELATYRALLEAEHGKHQEIGEQLWMSNKGVDMRSQRCNIMPLPTLDTLEGIRWMPSGIPALSTTQKDSGLMTITRGITSKAIPSRISTRKINSSFSDKDLRYTDKSSSVRNVDSASRSRTISKGMPESVVAPRDPLIAMKRPQVQHRVLVEEVKTSQVVLERPERAMDVTSPLPAGVEAMESGDKEAQDNKSAKSENEAKPQSSSDLPEPPFSQVEYGDFNGRSREMAEEEEFKWQPSHDVITWEPGVKPLEFKEDLSAVGSFMSLDRCSPNANFEDIESEYYLSDNIPAENKEGPATELVGGSRARSPAEESRDYRRITLSKGGVLTDNARIGDVSPTHLGEMEMVSPETAIYCHIEEQEVLEDGTTKREIVIQSRSEETVDMADAGNLQEVLGEDGSWALEHPSGPVTDGFIDRLLNLDIEGRENAGKASVNVVINEQVAEAESFPPPPDAGQLDGGEHDLEGPGGKHEEVLNITMSAADFRNTMLSASGPEPPKFLGRPARFFSDDTAEEAEEGEGGEPYGISGQHGRVPGIDGGEGRERSEQAETAYRDSFSKELCSPRLVEESIKVPQSVRASIVELLKEETEDPKLKLKGALEQMKGAVPDNLRDELSILTGDIGERPDNVSVNIKHVQQSSQRGVITLEAEVNVSQTLELEDFFSMGRYNEDEGGVSEIGSGLAFLNSQQELQGLLNGKDFPSVASLNGGDRSRAKVQVFNEQNILFEPNVDEDADEFSSTQGHEGLQTAFETTGSSEMESGVPPWLRKDADKLFGEEFVYKVSDPADSPAPLHTNVSRIVSGDTGVGGSQRPMSFIAQGEFATGTDGKGLVDSVYGEEWDCGSGDELAIEERDEQAPDSELAHYATFPKVQEKQRVVVSESKTQVFHGQRGNGVAHLDED